MNIIDSIPATPGYNSNSGDITPDNLNELNFPTYGQKSQYNSPQTNYNSIMNNTQMHPTMHNPSQSNYNHNMNNTQMHPTMYNSLQSNYNPNMNYTQGYSNTINPHDLQPNYAMAQPNYGQTIKMTNSNMGTRKAPVAMTRSTKIPGTKSVSGMTMVPKIEPKKTVQRKKEIIYPEFLSLIANLNDETWIKILKSASVGTFPRGVSYQKSVIIYNKNQKITLNQELSGTDQNKAQQYINFLQDKLSIRSELDNNKNTEDRNNESVSLNDKYKSWADVKKKSEKEALLNNFIAESEKFLQLNDQEYKSFRETIYRGYYSKLFDKTNIIISNGKIHRITILTFDYQERKLKINNGTSSKKNPNVDYLSEEQYLNPKLTINGNTVPIDLNHGMQALCKILNK